jgi:hypothetical protein
MKTKTLTNGNTKVWYDNEDEFIIVNKNQPLFDTIIDANLFQRKFSRMLLKEISEAGLNDIHDVFIDLDDSLQFQMDKTEESALNESLNRFNLIFHTTFKYHKNSNGRISIIFGQFENYQEFRRNYFCSFLYKLFACKIDIKRSEEKTPTLQGLTDFISIYAPECVKTFLEASRTMKFPWVINMVNNNHGTQ